MIDTRDPAPSIAFTFDLHDVDRPEDIIRAAEWFNRIGKVATFFIPSAMLVGTGHAESLRRLTGLGHEVGSHGHEHDWREIDALMRGAGKDLDFLSESHDRHCQFFGTAPTSFRSPRWCPLAREAIHELARLGYAADSSATPQRLPLFSSTPYHPGWWSSPRRVHYLAPGLVEVPTSTFLLPAGAPVFLTLRGTGSRVFLTLLELEARLDRNRPIVLQFHVEDFCPESSRQRGAGRPMWSDLTLRRRGGFRFKLFLRETNADRIVRCHREIIQRFSRLQVSTVTAIARDFATARGMGDREVD